MITLDPQTTALVLIDLQKGIAGPALEPRSGDAVVTIAKATAERFRAAGATVALVHVFWADDTADMLKQMVDEPMGRTSFPPEFGDFVDGLQQPGDIVIRKRNWGAFYGTDLDLHLRRRGIKTVVLGGISTNFGVESTARDAWERNYDLVILEDLCASRSADMHRFAVTSIFPRLARVRQSGDISF
jgi:nicotinamidase-related amidase